MSLETNMETTRRQLEELRRRVGESVKGKTLRAELLDGLARALESLAVADRGRDSQPADRAAAQDAQACGNTSVEFCRLNRSLQARSRSNQAMIFATDERLYLQDVCRIVVEDCGHAMVWIGYAGEDEGKTVRPVAHSGFEEGYLETLNITWADTSRGRGPTGTAIRTGKPELCRNMLEDANFSPWRDEALKRGYASSVVLPLMNEERAFGAITIYAWESDAFSPDEVALLSELSRDLSFGIQSIRQRLAHARSEALLLCSEERYRSIVELSPDAIFVNHDGHISYINPAGLALFGAVRAGQILGRSPFELFHPDCHERMQAWIENILDGSAASLTEGCIVRLDGTFRYVEVGASRYGLQEGRTLQVVVHDVTERKRAEEERARLLMETGQRAGETEAVLAAMNDTVLVYDADMNVVRTNPGFIPTYGFDPTGLNVRDIIHRTDCRLPDGSRLVLENQPTPRALRGEPVINQQLRITRFDGRERFLETTATPLRIGERIAGTVTVWHDITERKQVEEALRESEERFKTITSSTPDHILVQDASLRYTFVVNPQLGLTEQDMIGRTDHDFLAKDEAENLARIKRKVLETGMAVHVEVPLISPQGELQYFSGSFVPKHDCMGQVDGLLGYFRNVTEIKRVEKALRENEATLKGILDATKESVWLFSPDGFMLMGNKTAWLRFGKTPQDVVGKHFSEILPEGLARLRLARLREAVESRQPLEFEDERAGIAFRHSFYPVLDADGAVAAVASFSRDITEKQRAEKALAKREEGLRQALRLCRSFSFEWFVSTDEVRRGAECADILGLAGLLATQDTGANYFLRIHPDDRGAFEELVRGLTPDNDTYTTIYRVLCPDGKVVSLEETARACFDAHGGLERVAGITADVTERVRAQEALRLAHDELEERVAGRTAELRAANAALAQQIEARNRAREVASRLAAIVSSSHEAIFSKTLDGIIITWNKGAEELLGYAEQEVVGRHIAFLMPPERQDEAQHILDRIKRGERVERFETVRMRKDGLRIDVSVTISPIYDPSGKIVSAASVVHDITERKRMEDELRQASLYARSLIEASLDPLMTIGLSAEISDVNEAMEKVTGAPRRRLIGSDFTQYFTDPGKAMEGFERVLAEGMITDFPLTLCHVSGDTTEVLYNATVYRNAAGEVQGVFAAARDITRRKRAEEELARYRDHLEELVRQRTRELENAYQQLQEDIAARERVEEERGRLIGILEATSDMVSYSDARGRVLYFNQAARRILGIPPGADLSDAFIPNGHPDWANKQLQEVAIPAAIREGIWSGESSVLDAGGNEIPVSQVIVAHKDVSGQVAYFSTIARDMSEQKRIERELQMLASFPAENPSPVMRTTEEGVLIYANEAAEPLLRAWGCGVGDPIPAEIQDAVSKVLASGLQREIELAVFGRVYSLLFAYVHDTGHMNVYGKDITERKRAEDALRRAHDELEQRVAARTAELLQVNLELILKIEEHARTMEALRKSQERLAEAQRIAHLGNWDWNVVTDEIGWSDEMFRIFGFAPQAVPVNYARFIECVHPEDREYVNACVNRALQRLDDYSLQYRILTPDTEVRVVKAQGELTLDEKGNPVRMFGTVLDVTDQVRAQEEARIRQQQLVQADKLVSLGILVAGVAHEINNPNHSIMSNVTALSSVWESAQPILDRFYRDFGDFVLGGYEYSECRDKLPAMYSNALANSRRIEVIVNELRDFARNSPRESMTEVDLNAVVNSAVILVSNLVKKHTDKFSVELAPELPGVLGNFQRIEQVVINLIQNACQSLSSRDCAVTVVTYHQEPSGLVVLEVRDEGAGIPEESMKQICTPFFTTKRPSEGMGLGLWISSNIAHEHGGLLTFTSKEERGTCAILSIPAIGRPDSTGTMESSEDGRDE